MANIKALQKKIATLLYKQLSQYFNQVQILSYKPSASGRVTGKFIGDRRNYNFVLDNNQIQYLPSAKTKMDAAIARSNVQCTGSNHPCKGEKGTRCVPDTQSCKQREATPEGLARIKAISDTSKEITALALPSNTNKATPPKVSDKAPELDKDISLYDFLKYYSPWRPSGTRGFENLQTKAAKSRGNARSKSNPKPETNTNKKTAKPSQGANVKPETNRAEPKRLGAGSNPNATNPYDFLGINPKDFPNEAALYKAAKTAYRNLAAKYHPDRGGDPKMMQQLNNVMDKLKKMRRA